MLLDVPRPLAGVLRRDGPAERSPAVEGIPDGSPFVLADANGLMLIPGLQEIADKPELLVALSRAFGSEVEDYRYTLTQRSSVHATVPEIFLVSNMARGLNRKPPRRPDPPATPDGRLPVRYPHRKGWHTDQSYRRPPPDISLFYAVTPVARDRGQTLFADGTAAYAALPPHLKAKVDGLQGLHCQPGTARSREGALAGRTDIDAGADRAFAAAAGRAQPSGDRQACALCLRMGPDGLGRRPVRRHGAGPARRGRGAAR